MYLLAWILQVATIIDVATFVVTLGMFESNLRPYLLFNEAINDWLEQP